ncbi:DUF4064 domain-containing protein [Bhargavaea beijingensis]|uniref:DUF4064 domain-containing protein n=1 Tax=Bhargavaea beijingensis TaxID=426756 RepID=A0ABX9ZEC7_9BACL|nr:DUF4064 domain-containing protein [Bhargavaea beijingensis]MCW1927696.1 DUF4064 domain-containing protein [Bhargavaea beijingensis]RSK33354.1 DUF4064 domain-containing protein [Bhargavaea beijingensis]
MEPNSLNRPFKRTVERVLGIIGLVFNVLGIILTIVMNSFMKMLTNDPQFQQEFEAEIWNDPTLTESDAQMIIDMMYMGMDWMVNFGWFFIAALVISSVLIIVALIQLNKNVKLSGILFIIAGVLAGILSLTSILLYIAGIMCFVRKPPVEKTPYDNDTMRPL